MIPAVMRSVCMVPGTWAGIERVLSQLYRVHWRDRDDMGDRERDRNHRRRDERDIDGIEVRWMGNQHCEGVCGDIYV